MEVTGGCTKCSPGCKNDWALGEVWRMAHNPLLGDKWKGLVEKKNGVLDWTSKIKLFPETLEDKRLRSRKPKTFFIDSKADLFHPKVPGEFIFKVIHIAQQTNWHQFLFLTKRIKQMAEIFKVYYSSLKASNKHIPPPNIHLGVTICNQDEADEMLPIGLQIPGFDWVSAEPLLGPIFLAIDGVQRCDLRLNRVIVGCESGPKRRPCKPEWIRDIVEQCKATGIPWLVKQVETINGKVCHNPQKCAEYLGV